mgnify:CR=1 FL=1
MTEILIFIAILGLSVGVSMCLFILHEVVGDLEELVNILKEK